MDQSGFVTRAIVETDFSLLRGNSDRTVRSMKGWQEYKEVFCKLDTIFSLEFRVI